MSLPITYRTDQGTTTTPLQVSSQSFAKLNSKLRATEEDKQANTNIIPFGQCKLKPTSGGHFPCVPSFIQWKQTSPFSIEGRKGLTTDSFCMCSTGGKVSPLSPEDSFESIG